MKSIHAITHSRIALIGQGLCGAVLLLFSSNVQAQDSSSNPLDGFTPAGLQMGSPTGSFPLSGFDNINPYSGNLNFSLPLLHVGGRGGAGYTMQLPLNTKWNVTYSAINSGTSLYEFWTPSPGYSYTTPSYYPGTLTGRLANSGTQACYDGYNDPVWFPTQSLTRLTFMGPDGTEYELRDQLTQGVAASVPYCATTSANRGTVFTTSDGQSATFISDDDIYDSIMQGSAQEFTPSGYLKWKDGTVYRIDNGNVTWIRDRNGNKLSFNYTQLNLTSIVDSLNRNITIEYGVTDPTYGLCDRITYKGFGGTPRTIWVTYNSLSNALRSGYSIHTFASLFPEFHNASNQNYNPTTATGVYLPNGQHYAFYYNSYGEIARVELPTGGAYEYDWGAGLTGGPASGATCNSCQPSEIYRRVLERRVYSGGGTGSSYDSRMTLSRPESYGSWPVANVGYVTVNQYNSSGSLLTGENHYYYGGAYASMIYASEPTSYSPWEEGKEYQTDVLASDGTTVSRSVSTGWNQRTHVSWWSGDGYYEPSADPVVTAEATTLVETNQVSQTSFSYDQFNNLTDAYAYDYGTGAAGSILRHTHTDFLTTNPVNSVDYNVTSIHVRSLPTRQSVYDPSGVERARTTFEYDNYASDTNHAGLTSRSSISGLDSAYTTSLTTRGNATGTTHYSLDSSGSVTGSISAYAQYDVAGNVWKVIDARGNATTFDFTDRFGAPDNEAESNTAPTELGTPGQASYAFATKVTNAANQIAFAQFDYYLGRPVNLEDANGVVSSGYYDDFLDRPTTVIRDYNNLSAKKQTVFSYDDTNHIVTSASDLTSFNDTNPLISKVLYDGLGRTTESRQYEGSSHYIAVQTQYDPLGRTYKVSNPFRPLTPDNETAVWTTSAFDALGRVVSVTTPDNAVVTSSYSGNTVTASDQASKARKSVSDALGRLTTVYEDPSSLNFSTGYTYDVLNDLTQVSQGSQTRTFFYDSLKRLTSATNPESGTVSYTYDNSGNLLTRTDARNITATIAYDVLNRPTSKSYNDSPQTPTINFYYDSQTLPSGAPSFTRGYSTGALVAVTYGGGSAGTYRGYDALGRVVRQYQQTDSVNYLVEASYSVGFMTSETYASVPGASDRRTVTYTPDSAGGLSSLSSNATTFAPGASVSSILYAPQNALKTETYGNSLIHAISYNNRLQANEIKLGTSSNPTSILDLTYNYGTTNNNGNVQSVGYNGGGLSYTQTFTYDPLNRLGAAQENSGSSWSQTNGYDRYGNRWIDYGGGNHNLAFSTSTNRITTAGFSYDSNGNLTNDTVHTYTLDAENKILKVDSTTAYAYDGEGHRVRKYVGENTRFVYGIGGQLVAEFDGSTGHLKKEYVYGGATLITIEPTAVNSNGTQYSTPDNLGSPRVITNSSASVVGRHDYMPFGEELGASVGGRTTGMGFGGSGDNNRKKFTGYERDTETSLDFAQARYYSNIQGRFTRPDPMMASADEFDPQSWNRYAYVINNPLNLTDPLGLYDVGGGTGDSDPELAQEHDKKPRKPVPVMPPIFIEMPLPPGATARLVQTTAIPPSSPGTGVVFGPGSNGTGIDGGASGSSEMNAGLGAMSSGHGPTFRGFTFGTSAGIVGGSVGVKRDKYGNWYVSGGPSFGLSMPVTFSYTLTGKTYKMGREVTLEKEVRDVLEGPSAGVTYTNLWPPFGPTATWNTPAVESLFLPIPALGPPIPTGAGTLSVQEGLPELTYSPQGTLRIPRLRY